jgi:hypothetical protein
LRALGYSDTNGDFQWAQSLDKAREIGIMDQSKPSELGRKTFIRGDLAYLSYFSLNVKVKGSEERLKDKLNITINIAQAAAEPAPIAVGEPAPSAVDPEIKAANTIFNNSNDGNVIFDDNYIYYKNNYSGVLLRKMIQSHTWRLL